MLKNTAAQKVTFLVIDTAANTPATGDAANLTAYVSKDDGAVTVLGDTTAAELDATNAPGLYSFDLTQAETNADKLVFSGKSTTADISVVPMTIYTLPAGISTLTATDVENAVWEADPVNHSNPGTLGDTLADAERAVSSGVHGNAALKVLIDAVDNFVDTEITAIKTKTDQLTFTTANQLDVTVFSHTAGAKAEINAEVLDVISTDTLVAGVPIDEALRRIGAMTSGEVSGAGTGIETFAPWDGGAATIVILVDLSGNRTSITYN